MISTVKPRIRVREGKLNYIASQGEGTCGVSFEDIKGLQISKVLELEQSEDESCFLIYGKCVPDDSPCGEQTSEISLHKKADEGTIFINNVSRCALSGIELKVFDILLKRRGEIISRDTLYYLIYSEERMPFCRRIDNLISAIRKKIELNPEQPEHLITIRNKGYLLK